MIVSAGPGTGRMSPAVHALSRVSTWAAEQPCERHRGVANCHRCAPRLYVCVTVARRHPGSPGGRAALVIARLGARAATSQRFAADQALGADDHVVLPPGPSAHSLAGKPPLARVCEPASWIAPTSTSTDRAFFATEMLSPDQGPANSGTSIAIRSPGLRKLRTRSSSPKPPYSRCTAASPTSAARAKLATRSDSAGSRTVGGASTSPASIA